MTDLTTDESLFAPARIRTTRREDGTILLRSEQELGSYPRCVGVHLEHWASAAPDRPFVLERSPDGTWVGHTYGEMLVQVQRVAAWLLSLDVARERPIAVLSDNSVSHAVVSLAAMHIGAPVMPISPAYSLMSRDFAKLKMILEATRPSVIYVENPERFEAALAAVASVHDATVIAGAEKLAALSAGDGQAAVQAAFERVASDTVAKLLFTSGSTDTPKGVINTQRMLCASQQAKAQVWPFLVRTPPVVVDWLPWNHTFGGNHNFNLILRNGGTLYVDRGRPAPALFGETLRNLHEISPTIYFNVPAGFDALVTALRADEVLRRKFFSRLQVIFYAAAALPQNLWNALNELSVETVGKQVPLVSAWGSTETSPLATDCHFQAKRSGVIGVPVPGCEIKLVPVGEKLEARVRGANVTPGYWQRPDITKRFFDDEGFYCIGDAMRFADASDPNQGLVFDGRLTEDFKLTTGTWVNVGMLRVRALAALTPVAQDIVITGHDRREIGFLIFPNVAGCLRLFPELDASAAPEQVLALPSVRAFVAKALAALRQDGSSSTCASRAMFLMEPPSIDAGEITDKAYLNQQLVLKRRAQYVAELYSDAASVILA
ncbi:MAG TPA: feruloyl-CoA synthase [Polyangiales bacterium]|nr:feruloyl-CoA synthase [Polyangiales bacterium]